MHSSESLVRLTYSYCNVYLHIRYVFEDKSLIKFGIEIFSMHLCLIFGLFVRQQVELDKRVSQTGRPIRGGQLSTFDDLKE